MTDQPDDQPAARPASRLTRPAAVVAILGLVGMLVLVVLGLGALGVESGDRALHLSYAQFFVGLVATAAAITWTITARRRAGAIVVLVLTVLLSPVWLFLLILLLG